MRDPNSPIPCPNFLIPFLIVFLILLLCLQPPMPGTEGSSTAHPPNTGISQACSRIPPQIPGEQHQGMEAPAQNSIYSQRQLLGLRRREVVPCRAPTRVFRLYLRFGKGTLGQRVLRTQWECHNTRTSGGSSSRNSLWEEEQGATLPAPKSAHSWEEITAQGQHSGLDTVALLQGGWP